MTTIPLSLTTDELIEYTDWQRGRWQAWLRDYPEALTLSAGVNGDGGFTTVGDLVKHIFGAEQRYVQRLTDQPLSHFAEVPTDDADALFALGETSRLALRGLLETFPAELWEHAARVRDPRLQRHGDAEEDRHARADARDPTLGATGDHLPVERPGCRVPRPARQPIVRRRIHPGGAMKGSIVSAAFALAAIASGCDDSTDSAVMPTGPTPPRPPSAAFVNQTADRIRPEFQGPFAITLTAAPACSQLPSAMRSRSFAGLISPTSTVFDAFEAELSGADFFPAFDRLRSNLRQPIIERVGSGSFVAFEGLTDTLVVSSPTVMTAFFDGSITFCSALTLPLRGGLPPTCAAVPVECRSERHQLRFVRR